MAHEAQVQQCILIWFFFWFSLVFKDKYITGFSDLVVSDPIPYVNTNNQFGRSFGSDAFHFSLVSPSGLWPDCWSGLMESTPGYTFWSSIENFSAYQPSLARLYSPASSQSSRLRSDGSLASTLVRFYLKTYTFSMPRLKPYVHTHTGIRQVFSSKTRITYPISVDSPI